MQNDYVHQQQPPNGNLKGGSLSPGGLGKKVLEALAL